MDKKNENVIAKILSGHDAECMYDTRKETPGTSFFVPITYLVLLKERTLL